MAADDVDPNQILAEVIDENIPKDIWDESPFFKYRNSGNTNRGTIGEEFIKRYLVAKKLIADRCARRTDQTDMVIEGLRFEVKTASVGVNKTFQFNHVRLDRNYTYLLCLGICPEEILFGLWRKGVVAEGEAGRLVRMAEGQSVTYKLTKRRNDGDMRPIHDLPDAIRAIAKP